MFQFFPGLIMGFREGLEAFLVVAIILRYLINIGQSDLKNRVYQGSIAGIVSSLFLTWSVMH